MFWRIDEHSLEAPSRGPIYCLVVREFSAGPFDAGAHVLLAKRENLRVWWGSHTVLVERDRSSSCGSVVVLGDPPRFFASSSQFPVEGSGN